MRRSYRLCNRLPGRARRQPDRPAIPAYIASALTPPRATLLSDRLITRMAEDMREAAACGTGITEADLLQKGFTAAQIKLHAPDARALAQRLAGPSL
ncbi:hypothetical protein ACQR1Y_11960 [Bradyrhizobium sp. HKCCYLRH3099]|uniref:hypothetical protein n=1 Tax=unclassified Bradyrhizobium TaxID=2631580 RepID=UPI003EBAD11D